MDQALVAVMLYAGVTVLFLVDLWCAFRVQPHWPFVVALIGYLPIVVWIAIILSEFAGLAGWVSEGMAMLVIFSSPFAFAFSVVMTGIGGLIALLSRQHAPLTPA